MTETWRDVPGYEGLYSVSDLGRVRSVRTNRTRSSDGVLRQVVASNGYLRVALSKHGHVDRRPVHWIVLEAFVGPRPSGREACHFDGNPLNPCLSNLRWDTHIGNMRDRKRHGRNSTGARNARYTHPETTPRGERNGRAVLTAIQVAAIRSSAESSGAVARRLGVGHTTISKIRRGLIWKHLPPNDGRTAPSEALQNLRAEVKARHPKPG